jgi:hypothetical protein
VAGKEIVQGRRSRAPKSSKGESFSLAMPATFYSNGLQVIGQEALDDAVLRIVEAFHPKSIVSDGHLCLHTAEVADARTRFGLPHTGQVLAVDEQPNASGLAFRQKLEITTADCGAAGFSCCG